MDASQHCRQSIRLRKLPALVWSIMVICTTCVAAAPPPPNVLFILVDDLGWSDVGCYGSTFYETPHVDRLAREGVRFLNGYASCPVCSPTRASIMSGKYPARLGLTAHIGDAQPNGYRGNTPLVPAAYVDRLELSEATLAEAFHDAGYATFIAGKWHLGSSDRFWPEYQGFDINVGGWLQGGPFGGKQYFSPYGNPRLVDGPPGEHLPDRLATETVRFIESHRHKPFFAYLSFYSVHVPLVARKDLLDKYERKQAELAISDDDTYYRDGETKVRAVQDLPVYAAMVDAMDQAVGKVLDALDRLELADNTIVVFTSDNGGLSTGDRGISEEQGWPTSNLPLRAGKGWLYEGGIRVPLLIKSPCCLAGSTSKTVVTSTDFYPTLLALTGLPSRPGQHVDGANVASALRGRPLDRGPVFWHYPHYGNQGGRPGAVVRAGDWKLIQWYGDDQPLELYDLTNDLGEQENLAERQIAIRNDLLRSLNAWRDNVSAKYPTRNERFNIVGGG